jgi:ribosomal protein L24
MKNIKLVGLTVKVIKGSLKGSVDVVVKQTLSHVYLKEIGVRSKHLRDSKSRAVIQRDISRAIPISNIRINNGKEFLSLRRYKMTSY